MTSRKQIRLRAAALILVVLTAPAFAQQAADANAPAAETSALRREIDELKRQIKMLQEQMQLILGGGAPATPSAPMAPAAAPAAAPTRSQNLLNPAISAVFQTIGNTSLKRSDDKNGFSLSEAEIALQSVVDPYTRVDLFLSFPADGAPEVEEGFLTTTALPGPVSIKAGRFKSAFGKWNTVHNHAFFSVDKPEVLTEFFGEESLTDDGVSFSALIPNPWDAYIESISEVGTPPGGTSFNSERGDLAYLEHLTSVFTTSTNSTLEFGLSATRGRTGPTTSLLGALSDPNLASPPTPADHLGSAVAGVDVTYKWKPLRLNLYKSFLWQTEWLTSRRHLETLTPAATLSTGVVTSHGGYSYVEGQMAKRWKFGARFDRTELPDDDSAVIRAASVVVRFIPSEFQELRFQAEKIRRNDSAAARFNGDTDDTRIFFEWIPVIGAHGAHKY